MQNRAVLVLEDGTSFVGNSFGAVGETFGEAVFCTGMTGYQETLTDPSYDRQIVVATAPHIGNTGWNNEDDENASHDGRGRIWVAGYVVRDPSPRPSNWRSQRSLEDELRAQGIVGISGIDTRALTMHLRERGAMRAGISSIGAGSDALLERVLDSPAMAGADLVGEVTTSQPYTVPATGRNRFTVAAIDLGLKASTPRLMTARGMTVHVLPAASTIEDILALKPNGVFLSNGPGDPATATHAVELTREVIDARLPLFGICFGHQVFAQALGFTTYKLRFGHRGINQPVLDLATGRVAITAHNHGFAVSDDRRNTADPRLRGSPDADSASQRLQPSAVSTASDAVGGDRGRAPQRRPRGWSLPSTGPRKPLPTPYGDVAISHVCLNDGVIEGLELRQDGKLRAFSVQYHPEAAAGPHDAQRLFDRFAELMEAPVA